MKGENKGDIQYIIQQQNLIDKQLAPENLNCYPRPKAPDSPYKALNNKKSIENILQFKGQICTPYDRINIADVTAGQRCIIETQKRRPCSQSYIPDYQSNGKEIK